MRLIPIIRTSTDDQRVGLAAQYAAVEGWCRREGHELLSLVPPTTASGAKAKMHLRTDIPAALEACRQGKANGIIASRLDRVCRSVQHLCEIANQLSAMGCHLVITEQGIDTATPTGRLMFHMLGAIAEFERDLISDRTREGLAVVREKGSKSGKPIGKPSLLTGRPEIVSAADRWYRETGSYAATARHIQEQFGVKFDATQARRMVRNG